MTRPTRIHIHLDRLITNARLARRLHGGRVLAVIKANAYGHGDLACAQALAPEVEGFAVATLDEGVRLREHGVGGFILLLEGLFDPGEAPMARHHGLTAVIHQSWQWESWCRERDSRGSVWVKVDTGMHRLGFDPSALRGVCETLQQRGRLADLTLMTHFAFADGNDPRALDEPLQRFRSVLPPFPVTTSLANSGALLGYPAARGDIARPGLMLYGIDPGAPTIPPRQPLQPVMRLTSEVFAVGHLAVGESVGYGGLFRAHRPSRIGVIPCGYADGYPRTAPQGTLVSVDGVLVPLAGRVSMDMITVDLTDHPALGPGAQVELWGDQVDVATLAHHCGTVSYELLCRVRRALFHYHTDPQ